MIVRCSNTTCAHQRVLTSSNAAQRVRVLRAAGWSVIVRGGDIEAECPRCTRERP